MNKKEKTVYTAKTTDVPQGTFKIGVIINEEWPGSGKLKLQPEDLAVLFQGENTSDMQFFARAVVNVWAGKARVVYLANPDDGMPDWISRLDKR